MAPRKIPRFVLRRTPENRNSLAALHLALAPLARGGRLAVEISAPPPADLGPRDVLACSFATVELDAVAAEVGPIARAQARPLLIAGGPHPSADPEGALRLGFDAVFVGEAERTLPAFAARWCDGLDPRDVARDPVFLDAAGPFDIGGAPHASDETEEFPFAEIARGCPHSCAFCQVPALHGRKPRFRAPSTVAAGIAAAVFRGFKRFRFLAPDAFAYRGGGVAPEDALSELISACRGAGAASLMLGSFPSEVRPEHVTSDLLAIVARECVNRTVVLGAQSGSDETLALMRRGHTVDDSRRAIRLIAQAGLVPHVDLMFGFPGESRAARLLTIELGREVLALPESRLHLHAYLPLPGVAAWPAPPEPLEPEVLRAMGELAEGGRADGYWGQQIAQGRRIADQARLGLISISS
jgi:B12-binding domain/radical SAM domain protein